MSKKGSKTELTLKIRYVTIIRLLPLLIAIPSFFIISSSVSPSTYANFHLKIISGGRAAFLLISFLIRWLDKRVKLFFETMTIIIVYNIFYLITSALILIIAININTILVNVNNITLSLLVSIGSGLSWVAMLIPLCILISLIKSLEKQ